MMKNKQEIINIIDWTISFCLAVIIVNGSLFFIYHPAPWMDTDSNSTHGLFAPNSTIVYGDEGYGIRKVDKNGFVNPDIRLLNDSYVLFMGSSHTVGKEVTQGSSFVDILESEYGYEVYSIAMDGHYYPDIVKGFSAATTRFSHANSIVIEINSTDFSVNDLKNSLSQSENDESKYASLLVGSSSLNGKIKLFYQEYFPIVRAINKNIKARSIVKNNNIEINNYDSIRDYVSTLNATFILLRQSYEGKIIIAYHPQIQLEEDGSLRIVDSCKKKEFMDCCVENNIVFLDLSESIKNEYDSNHNLPYGFSNTSYGNGHLNKTGHRLMAELILEELRNVE